MNTAAEYPLVSADPEIQGLYEYCRRRGQSHTIAEVCAFRRPPAADTATTFMAGKSETLGFSMGGEFDRSLYHRYRRQAQAAGYSTAGKRYDPHLARFAGDPEAWIGSKDDIRRVAEQNRWQVAAGTLAVDHREAGPVAQPTIDKELVHEAVQTKLSLEDGGRIVGGTLAVDKGKYRRTFEDLHTKMNAGYPA